MDIDLTETQVMLQRTARDVLEEICPPSKVRELEKSEMGYSPDMWRQMAELGWLGLIYPEEYDGSELGYVDLAVLCKELGRALCPSPFLATVILSGGLILKIGSPSQKEELLPRIARGELILTLALIETRGMPQAQWVKTTAHPHNEGYVINGTKLFVEFGQVADYLLVVARTRDSGLAEDGLSTFLVERRSQGIECTPLITLARDAQSEVVFDNVEVSPNNVIGPLHSSWPAVEKVLLRSAIASSAFMVGASEKIHEMALDFSKNRIQFERPISSFQSIQHHLASTWTAILGAETLVYYAAWTLDQGLPARAVLAKCRSWAGDTFRTASQIGAQVHGGIGYIEETDTTLFLRRGKQSQLMMGPPEFWDDILAEELLGKKTGSS